MALIITVHNQKGGSGKTTTTMALAGELADRGLSVLAMDADAQGNAMGWSAASDDDSGFPATVIGVAQAGAKLHREIKKHLDNYDIIIVDCPPKLDEIAQSALMVSDLCIIPIMPSPNDARASMPAFNLVQQIIDLHDRPIARVLFTNDQGTGMARTVKESIASMIENMDIEIFNTALTHKGMYEWASLEGRTLGGLGGRAKGAHADVKALADEVIDLLGG